MIDFRLFGNSVLVTVLEIVITDHVVYVSYWNYIEKQDRTGIITTITDGINSHQT